MIKLKTTNGFDFYVDMEDVDLVSKYKWRAFSHGRGYRIARSNCHTYNGDWHSKTAFLHRFLLKAKKGQIIDHIDGNALNNCRSNLRFCTFQQNLWNKPLRKDSSTGFIGVNYIKKRRTWISRVAINGKRTVVGIYRDKKEAALAYNVAASFAFGEYAKLNKIT